MSHPTTHHRSRPDISFDNTPPRPAGPHLSYRPEIDGLRAIAVSAVILYHFGITGLSGGFVGVDVFFVISGYLIGGLLWSELQSTGRIDLKRFYMRRIRRLAPAYFAMAAVSSLAAAFILLPYEFREYGKHLIAATLWLSNVQFWREAGYFDGSAELKILLHTWSLSVEEQFYVVLPFVLLVLGFIRKSTVPVLVLLWAASLWACIALTPSQPAATFFLFPFRAWELLTGVLLALALHNRPLRLPAWVTWVGLGLIIGSILLIQSNGFPGWQAIIPVLGSALILANAGQKNIANSVLGHPAPVFVGLISYSLYLWHWPVLTLSKYWRIEYTGVAETAFWIGVSALLAIASWALVERPLRRATSITGRKFLTGTIAAGAATVGIGALAFVFDGLPARYGPEVRVHIAASEDFIQDWSRCGRASSGPLSGIETCAIGPDGAPEVIIWGDSHLRAMMDGFGRAALETQTPGLIIWRAGCPPLFDVLKTENTAQPVQNAACQAANDQIHLALPQVTSAKRILLVGRWAYYANGTGFGRDVANEITLAPAPNSGLVAENQADLFATALDQTTRELGTAFEEVYVMRMLPEIPNYDSRVIGRQLAYGWITPEEAAMSMIANPEVLAARVKDAETAIYPLTASGQVTLIDTWPALCPERCSVMLGDRSVYFDNNHLTNAGANALRGLFVPFLTGVPVE